MSKIKQEFWKQRMLLARMFLELLGRAQKKIEQFVSIEHGGDGNKHTFDVDAHSHLNFFDNDGRVYTAFGRSMQIGNYLYAKEADGPEKNEYEIIVTLNPLPADHVAYWSKVGGGNSRPRLRSNDSRYTVEKIEKVVVGEIEPTSADAPLVAASLDRTD